MTLQLGFLTTQARGLLLLLLLACLLGAGCENGRPHTLGATMRPSFFLLLLLTAFVLPACKDEICQKNTALYSAVMEDKVLIECLREKGDVPTGGFEIEGTTDNTQLCEDNTATMCERHLVGFGCPGAEKILEKWCK